MAKPGERVTRAGLPTSQSLLSFTHLHQRLTNQPKWFANASLKWFSLFTLPKPVIPLSGSVSTTDVTMSEDNEDVDGDGSPLSDELPDAPIGTEKCDNPAVGLKKSWSKEKAVATKKSSLLRRVVVRPSQSVITNLSKWELLVEGLSCRVCVSVLSWGCDRGGFFSSLSSKAQNLRPRLHLF